MKLMENLTEFTVHAVDGKPERRVVDVKAVCLGRAASRDIDAMEKMVEEKRSAGFAVYRPPNVCRKSRYLLTNEGEIEVQERRTSSEGEYVAIMDRGDVLVSVGSDVNDSTLLELESSALGKVFDTAKSKQACPAVVARDAWLYSEVKDHWDELRLRTSVVISRKKVTYQDFPLSNLVDLGFYLKRFPWLKKNGTVLLSGSSAAVPDVPKKLFDPAAKDGIFPDNFHLELHDPLLDRTITHTYAVRHLEWPDSDVSP